MSDTSTPTGWETIIEVVLFDSNGEEVVVPDPLPYEEPVEGEPW